MNRRRFIELLTTAAVGGTIAYSFPSIIVPRNLIVPAESMWVYPTHFGMSGYLLAPKGLAFLINDSSRILQGMDRAYFTIPH